MYLKRMGEFLILFRTGMEGKMKKKIKKPEPGSGTVVFAWRERG